MIFRNMIKIMVEPVSEFLITGLRRSNVSPYLANLKDASFGLYYVSDPQPPVIFSDDPRIAVFENESNVLSEPQSFVRMTQIHARAACLLTLAPTTALGGTIYYQIEGCCLLSALDY